ncbi:MAG: hypothetical protein R3C12_06850 [Planctomycetaceae bacterium]
MSDSQQQILAALRKNLPQATTLPDLNQAWTTYENPAEHFTQVLRSVGGSNRYSERRPCEVGIANSRKRVAGKKNLLVGPPVAHEHV